MILFDDVHFSYNAREILRGVSFSVGVHERVAVLGGSGEGKTTILRLILGLIRPDRGRIIVDGEDITLDSLNVSVGTTELLRVEGARSREIRIRSTSAPALRNLISLSPEVSREAVCIMP